MQTTLDFTNIVHTKENNPHSEQILFDQYDRLSKNCKTLYDALKRGERLTGFTIMTRYNMSEYRRRIADLRAAGLIIKETKLSNGCKEWFL